MISVIVPVYNAEKYINRCISSIISQTYSDWELSLIDDGSIDHSFSLMKEYEKKDKRIIAIHQENQGAGAARNRGLNLVTGDYVVFIDSDDYIEENYFSLLSNHNEDVVFIDVNRRDEVGKIQSKERLSILKNKSKDDILRGQMTGQILWGGVRKAVKRSLLEKYDIEYTQHKVGEEALYSFLVLFYAETISFIDVPVYNYEVHSSSLSQTFQIDPWGAVAFALREKVRELGYYDDYADTLNSFIVTASIVSLSKMAKCMSYVDFKKAAFEKIKDTYFLLDSKYCIDKKHMNSKARILFPVVKIRLFSIFYLICRMR